jgi:hypothetical protein
LGGEDWAVKGGWLAGGTVFGVVGAVGQGYLRGSWIDVC